MKDTLQYGYRNFRETIALKWGRHYRIQEKYKVVLGRDEEENAAIKYYAHPDDYIMEIADKVGPTLILKGENPSEEILKTCAGLIQKYSRHRQSTDPITVEYWIAKNKNTITSIQSLILSDKFIEQAAI
jgi:predicted ribosome quality control (RQC) complex YloA/Tae2 family protein